MINAFNAIPWLFDMPNLDLYPSAIGMVLALVYTYLPFAILPLYAILQTGDKSLEEAAADLGAGPLIRFWKVTVPLLPCLALLPRACWSLCQPWGNM